MIEIQVWDDPGWRTIDAFPDVLEGSALRAAADLAETTCDVRVAKDGESLARWLMGDRTIP